jgi:hypothetical protein
LVPASESPEMLVTLIQRRHRLPSKLPKMGEVIEI